MGLLSTYILELDRWNVNNDGTDAVNTTLGINNAISWATGQGYSIVSFPKGVYLIDEKNSVNPLSFMTLDLCGSTWQVQTNGLEIYNVIKFSEVRYSRITNGVIRGDKDTHDYYNGAAKWKANQGYTVGNKVIPTNTVADSSRFYYQCISITTGISAATEPIFPTSGTKVDGGVTWTTVSRGTHEGGTGVNVLGNSMFVSIDNLEICNCTGDAANTANTFPSLPGIGIDNSGHIIGSQFVLGSIDPVTGADITAANRVRSGVKILMNNASIVDAGQFGIYGSGYGVLGTDITATHYDIFFYRVNNSFLSVTKDIQFFDEVEIPVSASYARLVLHQSTLVTDVGCLLTVRAPKIPRHIYFEKCNLHDCRRQGLSLQGKHIYVSGCEIHHIKGTDPQSGIDIEDGYDINQYYYIEDNNFHHNNGYDLVITNGKYMNITGNRFTKVGKYVSLAINRPTNKVLLSNNVFYQCSVFIGGEAVVSNNQFYGCTNIAIGDSSNALSREILLTNCSFNNCMVSVRQTKAYTIQFNGCHFYNDEMKLLTLTSSFNSVVLSNAPQTFSSCSFMGADALSLFSNLPSEQDGWIMDSCLFNNVKGGNGGLPLGGTFNNCKFFNLTEPFNFTQTGYEIEFVNCKFAITSGFNSNNNLFTISNLKSFRMINCDISHKDGILYKINSVTDDVVLRGNRINYPSGNDSKAIISIPSTFAGNMIVIENNAISSSNRRPAIENYSNNANVIVRNNILNNMTLNFKNKELQLNNIIDGIVDPSLKGTTIPTSGYFRKGQVFNNSDPNAGGYLGWVCITAGYAETTTWVSNTIYSVANRVCANGHVFENLVGGAQSASVVPVFTTADGAAVNDTNGIFTWQANTVYSLNSLIMPLIPNGYYYKCIASGISGATQPNFAFGGAYNDGSAKWNYVRPFAIWKEIGVSAVFKRYGQIIL